VPGGVGHLYVWYDCSYDGGGMSAAEFGLQVTGGLFFMGFTPWNGVVNTGSGTNLQLKVDGCPTGALCAGDISLFSFGAGSVCIVSSTSGLRVTMDCSSPTPTAWPLQAIGWDSLAPPACYEVLCSPVVAVEPPCETQNWGAVKSLYR
jgi:hypothetical protein